jgi:hypothetical protein
MKHYILMADVLASGLKDQKNLMIDFKSIVRQINEIYASRILSPLTITLGDEFQCVLVDLATGIEVIIAIEELIIQRQFHFKLRYILNQGRIETPINRMIAYEMLGEGLTDARTILNNSKSNRNRIVVKIDNHLQNELFANSFILFENIIEKWNLEKDFEIISNFIKFTDYKTVAENINKTKSQVWKREKTLNIEAYNAIKNILNLTPQIA